jgi:hydroxyquinol 1,2-dioxygenase
MPYATEENLTDLAVERWGNTHTPRFRELMQSLIKHLHAFIREVELTQEEYLQAVDWLARAGQICTGKRQEFILAADVLGASMLVDAINHRLPSGATPSTVLGPFHIDDSPEMEIGANMAEGIQGDTCYVTGTIRGLDGKTIEGAELDGWQADAEGLYESQIGSEEPRLRALFHSGADGKYVIHTIAPSEYPIPMDGPVGDMMRKTDLNIYRPPHIHFHVSAPGYEPVVTHIFRKGGRFLDCDVVYAVKEPLITEFKLMPPGKTPSGEMSSKPFCVVNYDFVLSKNGAH